MLLPENNMDNFERSFAISRDKEQRTVWRFLFQAEAELQLDTHRRPPFIENRSSVRLPRLRLL